MLGRMNEEQIKITHQFDPGVFVAHENDRKIGELHKLEGGRSHRYIPSSGKPSVVFQVAQADDMDETIRRLERALREYLDGKRSEGDG